MLKVKEVTKYYGDKCAVDNLSFEVKEGEVFGLLGINGAGKTTTFRMIMGLLEKNSGEITLNNKSVDYTVTDKIGFLTEERSLLTKMTVFEQIIYFGTLKGMEEKEIEKKLNYYLEKFEITEYKNRKLKELSKGNQQKIQFICSIINSPKLLILDEPFSGLDPINVELFKKEILDLKELGTIIIFSTHRMEHVEYFCDSLLILVNGKTVLEGNLKEIKKSFGKKNVIINGLLSNDVKEEIKKIKGVLGITKNKDEYIVKIENEDYVKNIFKCISKGNNDITKFVVEEPSLNEIFIEKVGEKYEK